MFITLLGSRKVFFVGNPIPQECYFLQAELEKRGISTTNKLSLVEQLEYLNTINGDELIIIFNYGYYEINSFYKLNKDFLNSQIIYIGPKTHNIKLFDPTFSIILPLENLQRSLLMANYVVSNLSEICRKAFPLKGNISLNRK
ncbi:MAG: hypothetical protein PUD27_00035 [Solobacterium sp.]|nr:hypothetical protein [Solobacterium sp.]MDD6497136.1 hypothetical protein [Solobacterium sp.]MDD6834691.1 hypothetical protein [Solobacterium sp.]MDD6885056.1 hypothetical protein [Solobacterium sp.]